MATAKLTAEELRARRAKKERDYRRSLGKLKRRQLRQRDEAKCFDMERLLKRVEKESEDGCWIWTGSYQRVWDRIRPIVRAGAYGKMCADYVMKTLTLKAPLPPRTFLVSSCGRVECIAPHHLLVSNQQVERAKKRMRHEQEVLGQGRDEQERGDGRSGSGDEPAQRSRRAATG